MYVLYEMYICAVCGVCAVHVCDVCDVCGICDTSVMAVISKNDCVLDDNIGFPHESVGSKGCYLFGENKQAINYFSLTFYEFFTS
jgi:hypothetical protein